MFKKLLKLKKHSICLGGGGGGGVATLLNPPYLNPLKIKNIIVYLKYNCLLDCRFFFVYPPRGFKGVKPPINLAPFDFLTSKGTYAESGFENGTTYLSKVRKK